MLIRKRPVPEELLFFRFLNTRMELSEKQKHHYSNLEKGYTGEVKFDLLAEQLKEERLIINDLFLEVNNSYFQIDTLIISQGMIHLLEVKNYQGDWYLEADKLYTVNTGREYKNPVDQLKRSTALFRQLLQTLKQNYPVEASVIFINPEFTLYQAPMDQPIILPTQVNRFFNDLNNTPSKLNDGHRKLAQNLLSLHQTENPFTFTGLPDYHYDQLLKGMYCETCTSILLFEKNSRLVCERCGGHEKIEQAILRSVKEFKLLFPQRKITTQSIYEWRSAALSRKTFCRVLKKNFTAVGSTSDTYYE
ncbi:nuclease-related domain-containing protein [Cytobacillus oceanisediminis]|uniref:nuclease-related domain-containing protein n=1 Tax=Cytobacillus oceanisediminis TaxID=665099 RepID=UPI001FB4DC7C|nr:nuclease-related domain-containing protein [Cytobacillus oceanisediminis]UOE55468.1 NERD domain-containing protein [Cytobacillus oceanisediminis]